MPWYTLDTSRNRERGWHQSGKRTGRPARTTGAGLSVKSVDQDLDHALFHCFGSYRDLLTLSPHKGYRVFRSMVREIMAVPALSATTRTVKKPSRPSREAPHQERGFVLNRDGLPPGHDWRP